MGKRRKETDGDQKKKKKPRNLDDFFEADIASSDGEEEKQDEEKIDTETVYEKKVRLARAYLDKVRAAAVENEENGDGDDENERDGRRDAFVADVLQKEQMEESGRVQRKLACRILEPEVVAEGRYVVRKHKQSVTAVALSEDDVWGFSASKDGLILQWDVESGKYFKYELPSSKEKDSSKKKKSSKRIFSLAVDSDGRYLATGGDDRCVHLWDIRSRQYIKGFPGHRGAISAVGFRQGSTQLFSGSYDRSIKLWSAEDRSYIETLFGHQSEVVALDCLRQERPLSAARDRTLRLWKVAEETQLVFRAHVASLESCCMVTNSEFISGSDDGSVALWGTMKKKPIFIAKDAHGGSGAESWVGAVASCRNSDVAASGAGDGKIQLWNIQPTNRILTPLHSLASKGFVNSLAFARSGKFVVAGIGQEPRLGRWERNGGAKNGVVVHSIQLSSS